MWVTSLQRPLFFAIPWVAVVERLHCIIQKNKQELSYVNSFPFVEIVGKQVGIPIYPVHRNLKL